jgi:hypothetical protein
VAWQHVQRPLELGVLWIMDLNRLGVVFRLRCLWLRRIDRTRPWASLPFREDAMVTTFFQASFTCVVGDENSILFLEGPLAVWEKHPRCRVGSALQGNVWIRDIVGPYTVLALIQYV